MSNLNENEDEVPTILHDKNRHEFQLTLSTFDNVNKVSETLPSIDIYSCTILTQKRSVSDILRCVKE